MNDAIRMQLSAFVDGELPENEAEMLLRRMSQDVELRQEVAEYLALGRIVRGELGVAGADRLHERVAAEIDHRPAAEMDIEENAATAPAIRPLLGFAVAATVALLAIFGLQQTNSVDDATNGADIPLVANPVVDSQLERQRQYFLSHANASSKLGANGMSMRLVTLPFSEDIVEESEIETDTGVDQTEALEESTNKGL